MWPKVSIEAAAVKLGPIAAVVGSQVAPELPLLFFPPFLFIIH